MKARVQAILLLQLLLSISQKLNYSIVVLELSIVMSSRKGTP